LIHGISFSSGASQDEAGQSCFFHGAGSCDGLTEIRTAGLVFIPGVSIGSTALPFLPGRREMRRDDPVSAAASEIVTG